MDNYFSKKEIVRFSRQLNLPNFSLDHQKKLKEAKVLIIGAGGLGCPVLTYLIAAGVGEIGVVDGDTVSLSNLHRQVLYTEQDLGKLKVHIAVERLQSLNESAKIVGYPIFLNNDNILEIFKHYDYIVDGTDNFPTRYLVNDACVILGKPLVFGSIFRYEGQVSVFNVKKNGKVSPNYRDVFPVPPKPEAIPNCADGGVLGTLPGIIGSIQANEVLKLITGIGNPLIGELFIFDVLNMNQKKLKIPYSNLYQNITQLIDYQAFCNPSLKPSLQTTGTSTITVKALAEKIGKGEKLQLIDVRHPHEFLVGHLPNAHSIPLNEIGTKKDQIALDQTVVLYCRSGVRSLKALHLLQEITGLQKLLHLEGGLLEYAAQIDDSIPVV